MLFPELLTCTRPSYTRDLLWNRFSDLRPSIPKERHLSPHMSLTVAHEIWVYWKGRIILNHGQMMRATYEPAHLQTFPHNRRDDICSAPEYSGYEPGTSGPEAKVSPSGQR
ncbi:hypothetical protein AVEN_194867-1 [Araneus ventricosus]|uniref:Uncharacterized protein n=1 Tax=Araneus ventricosus TaxID=182803 RepID=A0A4Y2B3J2_ARAVE|nr:hypothetical protein AVEN_194867-1 [Araneus ventricosus]